MFDRTYVQKGPSHLSVNARITEKRAPTDESVRLLREMESAARSEVDRAIRLESNNFKAVLWVARDVMTDDTIFRVHFDWNGEACKAELAWPSRRGTQGLGDAIQAQIAKELAATVLHSLSRDFSASPAMHMLAKGI